MTASCVHDGIDVLSHSAKLQRKMNGKSKNQIKK